MDLQTYKQSRGLSLTALARSLNRPVSTVHAWLNGSRKPDWSSLADIARATAGEVTADDFLAAPAPPANQAKPPGLAEAQSPFIHEARALGLDPDAIAAAALKKAIGDEKARRWAEENREAIEAYNRYVEEHGLPLAKYRMF